VSSTPRIALLAGASGLIGGHLLEALLGAPDYSRVFALTRRPFGREHPKLANRIVAFERMDGADLVTVGLAQDKAWTALMNRMPTRDLAPLVQPGAEFYGYESIGRGRTIVFAGGMPLLREGVLVGGVGVSGGSVEEDQAAVDAAVAAFA